VFYDSAMLEHEPGPDHPEHPQRLGAVMGTVEALESRGRLARASPRAASDAEVLRVHTSRYVDQVRREIESGRGMLSTGDTEVSTGSLSAALAAAGTVVSAVDAVVTGRARNAFCAVRPPGHQASTPISIPGTPARAPLTRRVKAGRGD
jgi:acetoin utilization deacetylase AcuC-like enzyme